MLYDRDGWQETLRRTPRTPWEFLVPGIKHAQRETSALDIKGNQPPFIKEKTIKGR
jgi:hypothetical protein